MRTTDRYYLASDYVSTIKDIGRFLRPHVERVDFEFDEYNGHIHAVLDDYYFPVTDDLQTMKHVVRILNNSLLKYRASKVYYGRNGKKRHSEVLTREYPDISGMSLDGVFWRIVKQRYRLLCKLVRSHWEVDVRDEIQEFYDDVLTDFLYVVIQNYYDDIHEDENEDEEEYEDEDEEEEEDEV